MKTKQTLKHYSFKVFLNGIGKTPQEAWNDVLEELLDALPDKLPNDIEFIEGEEIDCED